jgi:type I restriction enzyme M protein
VRRELFAPADRPGYSRTQVEAAQVKATIFGHCEVSAFNARVTELFGQWEAGATPLLTGMQKGQRPGALIEVLSESLLEMFRRDAAMASLIDLSGCASTSWTTGTRRCTTTPG